MPVRKAVPSLQNSINRLGYLQAGLLEPEQTWIYTFCKDKLQVGCREIKCLLTPWTPLWHSVLFLCSALSARSWGWLSDSSAYLLPPPLKQTMRTHRSPQCCNNQPQSIGLPVCSERCRDRVCCRPNTFPHTSQGKSWSLNFQDGNPFPTSSPSFSVSMPKNT